MTNAKSNRPSLPGPSHAAVNYFITAANGDNAAIVEFLDKYGAGFIDEKNNYGHTALMLAARGGYKGTVALLLERGAAVDVKNSDGQTALMLAARGGYKDIAELLLGKGADIDGKDRGGRTALMWAVVFGHEDTVLLLLENGAAIDVKDNDGNTALMVAEKRSRHEIGGVVRQWAAEQQRQKEQKEHALAAAAAIVESRIEKLKRLRPAKPVLRKPGSH